MLERGCGRDTTVIALGGGVVGDLAGFVAATFLRGVPFVQIPTTLLAMIDASIGGKTGVDTVHGKNLVGAFHPPAVVIADPQTLRTLSAIELLSGAAEAIKHGVIADAEYFAAVAAILPDLAGGRVTEALYPLIARSIEIKANVVRGDLRERGLRKTLNFGHTLGHAIEALSDYRLLHGQAIAIGMALESRLAERIGVASPGLPLSACAPRSPAVRRSDRPAEMSPEAIVSATRSDKKARQGHTEYSLPSRLGAMAGEETGWAIRVPEETVRAVLA
jgi:3-dehydroquinate synthase